MVDIEPAADWQIVSGYQAMLKLLKRNKNFTAVLAAGDLLAIGAMRALKEADLDIPEDISLMGIDDIDLDSYLCPPLTTVSQSISGMATEGIEMLLEIIQGRRPSEKKVIIEPQLIKRMSTASIIDEK